MARRMVLMLTVTAVVLAALGLVKFWQIQEAVGKAASFQPPPQAVTTIVAEQEECGAVPRGRKLTDQPHAPEVPAGLPSSLLERRPDIRAAEQQLVAANARIGVARAAFFPQITLTATGGYRSAALTDLFQGPAGLWSFVGALTQPLFAGGRIRSGVRLAEARQEEAVLVYQQTIQQSFREVLATPCVDWSITKVLQSVAWTTQELAQPVRLVSLSPLRPRS